MNISDQELLRRREFFKKTLKGILPILTAGVAPQVFFSCKKNGNFLLNQGKDGELSSATGVIDGHEYVDLGLSVKWALSNVGAQQPYQFGSYSEFTKGVTSHYDEIRLSLMDAGFKDGDSISGTSFDPVIAEWGQKWKTPTEEQFNELIDNCSWEEATCGDAKGVMLTSLVNGNSIFLPYAGCVDTGEIKYVGIRGYYWSGTLSSIAAIGAYGRFIRFAPKPYYVSEEIGLVKYSIRPISDNRNSSGGCNGNCSSSCSGSSSGNVCSDCSTSCSGGCRASCDYNCAATCKSHCYGSCDDTCGGTCKYVSAGANCSGCSQSCYNRCYQNCSYACSSNCQSSCVHGSK